MRVVVSSLVMAAVPAVDLDVLGGGRPQRGSAELDIEARGQYRFWGATTEAADFTGAADEADYRFADGEGGFVGGQITWWIRPWQLEAELMTNPVAGEQASVVGRLRMAFLGNDHDFWDFHPFFELSLAELDVEMDHAGATSQESWREWRFTIGMVGSYDYLAGTQADIFIQTDRYPSIVGFEDDTGSTVLALRDEDFQTWQLGVGFTYDWGEQLATNRRKYNGFFAALRGEASYLWHDVSNSTKQAARSATATSDIDELYYYDFSGFLEAGFLYQNRSREGSNAGLRIKAGYQLYGRFLGIDGDYVADPNTILVKWDRTVFDHGPFVRVAAIF